LLRLSPGAEAPTRILGGGEDERGHVTVTGQPAAGRQRALPRDRHGERRAGRWWRVQRFCGLVQPRADDRRAHPVGQVDASAAEGAVAAGFEDLHRVAGEIPQIRTHADRFCPTPPAAATRYQHHDRSVTDVTRWWCAGRVSPSRGCTRVAGRGTPYPPGLVSRQPGWFRLIVRLAVRQVVNQY